MVQATEGEETMTATQQPEAILLADCADSLTHVAPESGINPFIARMASELRRLHSRVTELEEINRFNGDFIILLDSQLEAIGAGGVESLRRKGAE